eukprot:236080-Pleurochrysis_carterae.AAC.1
MLPNWHDHDALSLKVHAVITPNIYNYHIHVLFAFVNSIGASLNLQSRLKPSANCPLCSKSRLRRGGGLAAPLDKANTALDDAGEEPFLPCGACKQPMVNEDGSAREQKNIAHSCSGCEKVLHAAMVCPRVWLPRPDSGQRSFCNKRCLPAFNAKEDTH